MKAMRTVFPLGCLGLILYVCSYKIGNTDFWWHIKAGQMLRDSGWITTDPFAYTRLGEAYLATHEWLAQVIMSIFFDFGGWAGITVLRITLIALAFGIPLQIHRKNIWINALLVVLAVASARPALTDRPQLFTFVMFSLVLFFCISYLEVDRKKRRGILCTLPVILIVWSNLHGAASVIGIALFGALCVQQLFSRRSDLRMLLLCAVAMLAAPLFAPGGFDNISYLYTLLTEKSATLIAEWQPASWGWYLKHTGFFWLSAVVSMFCGRRNILFSLLALLGIGYLSRTAQRHEILFIITGLHLTIYQLRYSAKWNGVLENLQTKKVLFPVISVITLFCLSFYTHVRAYDINRNDHLFGYGVFEPMRGASDYLHREQVSGNMFNNYNAGGELLFRNHQVFLDGRNLDYGYDYMLKAVNAGVDQSEWNALEEEYDFTHAVIYYNLQAQMDPLPYTDLLDNDPEWALVYLDDWAAVYVKTESGKRKVENEIITITPKSLENQEIPLEMGMTYFRQMESELSDMIAIRPDGVKARMHLAKLYTAIEEYAQAEKLLEDARAVQPKNFRIYLGLMKLRMEQGRWDEALVYVKKAKRTAGFSGLSVNEDLIDQIRSKAKSDY
jgi:hypothetical protein